MEKIVDILCKSTENIRYDLCLTKLKNLNYDIKDIKRFEELIKLVETYSEPIDSPWIDIHRTKNSIIPMLTENNVSKLLEIRKTEIYLDEVKHAIVCLKNKEDFDTELEFSRLEDELVKNYFQSKSYDILLRKLHTIAYVNKINPVKDYLYNNYITNKDKISNKYEEVTKVFKTIKICSDELDISYMLFKKWIVSCVACQLNPKFIGHGALTFTGKQGKGKSTWFRNLIPLSLRKYFKEEFSLDTTNKDNYIESVQYWIVELSELGRTVKDSDRAKSHITKEFDEYRAPYDRTPRKHKRTTVYGASVDKDEFLKDDVNRRWWTIKIIDTFGSFDSIDIDMFWAEVYSMYINGVRWWLNAEETDFLNKHNEQFTVSDDSDSMIKNFFDWESEERYYVSSNDIANLIGNAKINNTRIGLSLKKMNVPYEVFNKKTKQKMYEIPKVRKILIDQAELFNKMKYDQVYPINDARED